MSVEQLRADLTDCINAKLETWRELDVAKAEIEHLTEEVKKQADGWLRSSGATNAALDRAEAAEATCVYLRNECEIRFNDLAAERAKNTELEEQLKAASDQASDGIAKTAAWEAMQDRARIKHGWKRDGRELDELYEARTAKLVEALVDLLPPDADVLRNLEGDQKTHDRYWMGWTAAIDEALAAAKASK